MEGETYLIESATTFSESLIWQLNRDFYQQKGPEAWREGIVPHHLTSNAMVGKTYAALIFAFLKDTAQNGQTQHPVYILELGAGHGRLAFHILKQLDHLIAMSAMTLPPYCYLLSDISEDNLDFFQNHKQFQPYLDRGVLDLAYYDAIESTEINLRYSKKKILPNELKQPLLAIANYFFDSLPTDLFQIKNTHISTCSVTLESDENPADNQELNLIENIQLTYESNPKKPNYYSEAVLNEILEEYKELLFDTYLFFPHAGLQCIEVLRQFSPQGLMMLTMDKGFHNIHDLENVKHPEIIKHGSFSVWVNFHAIQSYCEKHGGQSLFPSSTTFFAPLGCLFFLPEENRYPEMRAAYQRFVNDFGPDDFNGIKRLSYQHLATLKLSEIVSILRLSAYDYTMFINLLPRIKQVSQRVTYNERNSLKQTMDETWRMYFSLYESQDLASEIGGILYDLGFYKDSLQYFDYSADQYGPKPDVYYNQALCFYQLREDDHFLNTLKEGKMLFPDFQEFGHLDKLDLNAQ